MPPQPAICWLCCSRSLSRPLRSACTTNLSLSLSLSGRYSTTATAEGKSDDDWWYIAETKRTVNQSCVHNTVIDAMQLRRPECWNGCAQPTNATTPCFLRCLFETMVGNATAAPPVHATPPSVIERAFESAFAEGGCPEVKPGHP